MPDDDGTPVDWKVGLHEDYREHPALADYKVGEGETLVNVPPSLVKSHLAAQKFLGGESIPVPKGDDDTDALNMIYKTLGRPEKAEGYEIVNGEKLPKDFKIDEKTLGGFKDLSHGLGLGTKQVQGVYDWYAERQAGEMKRLDDMLTESQNQAEAKLREDWGPAYDRNMKAAKDVFDKFGDEEALTLLSGELGDHPAIIKMFHAIYEAVGEDGFESGGGGGGMLNSESAQAELAGIEGDSDHAYYKAEHPGHEAAVKRVRQLNEIIFGKDPVVAGLDIAARG